MPINVPSNISSLSPQDFMTAYNKAMLGASSHTIQRGSTHMQNKALMQSTMGAFLNAATPEQKAYYDKWQAEHQQSGGLFSSLGAMAKDLGPLAIAGAGLAFGAPMLSNAMGAGAGATTAATEGAGAGLGASVGDLTASSIADPLAGAGMAGASATGLTGASAGLGATTAGLGTAATGGGLSSAISSIFGGGGGSGMSSISSTVSNLLGLGQSIYGLVSSPSPSQAGQQAQQMVDPFSAYRPQYAAQLSNLMQNPSSVTSLPGYQFELGQGTQALERTLAAKGQQQSGQEQIALQQYGEGLAGKYYQQDLQNLMTLSGAGVAPTYGGTAGIAAANAAGANQAQNIGGLIGGLQNIFSGGTVSGI